MNNLDPNKAQAIILLLFSIVGLAGWLVKLDITPLVPLVTALVGWTEAMKANAKAKEKQDGKSDE